MGTPAQRLIRSIPLIVIAWSQLLAVPVRGVVFAQEREAAAPLAEGDVRRFGATGDGVNDDTDAIQRAIDSKVGQVTFGKGTYRISRPLEITLDETAYTSLSGGGVAKLEMLGPGPAIRVIGTHRGTADPKTISQNVWDHQAMPLIDGVRIMGKHPEAVGIEATGTMQLTLSRLHLRGLLHGVRLIDTNRNVVISECHIYENNGIGVFYDNVDLHQSNLTNCHISYNAGGGVVSLAGNVRNIHIAGCDIESNMSPTTKPTANVLIDCSGSTAGTAEVAITGCTIQHNNPSPDSANVRIIGSSKPTERLPRIREGNITIVGNVLSDVQVNIHLKECRGVAISGNTIWQGYRHNLLFESCSSIVMSANNLDRNPRYDYGNTAQANNGVVFRDCEDCTISGLHLSNVWREEAGVILDKCRRFNLTDSSILDCDSAGLLLRDVADSRISDCLIRNDRPVGDDAQSKPEPGKEPQKNTTGDKVSIRVEGSSGVMVTDNLLGSPIVGPVDGLIISGNLIR